MTNQEKAARIKALSEGMLEQSTEAIRKYIERAVQSSAIDLEAWEPNQMPMILPKSILIAALLEEAEQYKAKGTSFEKEVNGNVKNLRAMV